MTKTKPPTTQAVPRRPPVKTYCVWSEDNDGNWDTGCGRVFVLNDGSPIENGMVFCAFCGNHLDEERNTCL